MKPDFALEDPATFNTVLPWSHFHSAGGRSSRDGASSKLLQEKVNYQINTQTNPKAPEWGPSFVMSHISFAYNICCSGKKKDQTDGLDYMESQC